MATDGVNIAAIHTHKQDDSFQFYKDIDSTFQWIYMPLSEGEYLTEICRRYGYYVQMDAFGLLVSYIYYV